jgi:hypothetical protein
MFSDAAVKDLVGLEFGKIIERFAATVSTHPERSDVATAADALRLRRNDLAHARPAKIDGEEMLYRWDAKRGRIAPITHSWLESFTSDVRETRHAANLCLLKTSSTSESLTFPGLGPSSPDPDDCLAVRPTRDCPIEPEVAA